MTIYIPKLRELPPAEMARLDPAATFSERRSAGWLTAYVYDWPDMRVVVNVFPEADLPEHLEQFVGWLEDRTRSLGKALSGDLAARIRSTTLVLGFVIEKATDREVWHDRVQDMIGMICFNTKSIVFWEGMSSTRIAASFGHRPDNHALQRTGRAEPFWCFEPRLGARPAVEC